jgi:DNA-binding CsgD family transcriptional regulator
MENRRVIHMLAEIVRRQRNNEIMVGELLRLLHAEFGCKLSAMLLQPEVTASEIGVVLGAPYEQIDQYRTDAAGKVIDPLLMAAIARRAPIYDELLLPNGAWHEHPFYQQNAKRWDAEHYMVCPLLGPASVIGTIHFARGPTHRGFQNVDLHLAALVTSLVSVELDARNLRDGEVARLPIREMQVARLAADGMNNLEIATQLGLARETVKKTLQRVYARLGVHSRAQMAAILARERLL